MIGFLPLDYDATFLREYRQTTVETRKETYAHKTKRLIYEKFGDQAQYAYDLCFRESGCRYNAINPTSGAAGLGQALPPSKMKCGLTADQIECQVNWFYFYVIGRYKTAQLALGFHDSNGWY